MVTLVVLLLVVGSAASALGALARAVIGAGAGRAVSATHSVSTTVGEAVVGRSTSSTHVLGSGFWSAAPQTITAVDDTPRLPDVFRLHPNVPNPFNPRTEIRFELPQAVAALSLRVYDLAGRRVATLAEGAYPAGRHAVVWNGDDDDGRPVASGVYLYRFDSPAYRETRKLALVR